VHLRVQNLSCLDYTSLSRETSHKRENIIFYRILANKFPGRKVDWNDGGSLLFNPCNGA